MRFLLHTARLQIYHFIDFAILIQTYMYPKMWVIQFSGDPESQIISCLVSKTKYPQSGRDALAVGALPPDPPLLLLENNDLRRNIYLLNKNAGHVSKMLKALIKRYELLTVQKVSALNRKGILCSLALTSQSAKLLNLAFVLFVGRCFTNWQQFTSWLHMVLFGHLGWILEGVAKIRSLQPHF